MWFLKKRFDEKAEDEKSLDEHLDYLNSLKLPAVKLSGTKNRQFNKLGGLPNLPDDLAWPHWIGKPLAFLCQLDLSTIPAGFAYYRFPRSGCLYFFYDGQQRAWGHDPEDIGNWQVLYTSSSYQECRERNAPEGLDEEYIITEKFVTLSLIDTYPDFLDECIASLHLSNNQFKEYVNLRDFAFEGEPSHQLFGHPNPVQNNDMDEMCQLVSHGIYCGDSSGYESEAAKKLMAGRTDWLMLLQLDTDNDTGMMWGDAGMLYFWIKKDDLAAGRFENCWMILQCG